MQDLYNIPGIIKHEGKVFSSSKIKSFIEKRNLTNYDIVYVQNPSEDFKILNRQLQELVNKHSGKEPPKEKPKQEGLRECPYQYRLNQNTVLMAYTEEDLNKLKKWHNII